MTRSLMSSNFARCDAKGCRNAIFGTASVARDHGWYAFSAGGVNPLIVHRCPTHYPVQNSGHPEKESNMATVSNIAAKDFITIRDEIVAVLHDNVYFNSKPLDGQEGFDPQDFIDVAESLMQTYTLIKPEDTTGAI